MNLLHVEHAKCRLELPLNFGRLHECDRKSGFTRSESSG